MKNDPLPIVTLTVVGGAQTGKTWTFKEPDNFLIGRQGPGCLAHLALDRRDKTVSHHHLLLEVDPPNCYIQDAGSRNGVYIVRPRNSIVYYLPGRDEIPWLSYARQYAASYSCREYWKVEDGFRIEDGDLIRIGDTVIEMRIALDDSRDQIPSIIVHPFRCIRCGQELMDKEESLNLDFICSNCRQLVEPRKYNSLVETITCSRCGEKNLTEYAKADDRAYELRETAQYWCRDCVQAQVISKDRDKIENGRIDDYYIVRRLGSGGFGEVFLVWSERTARIAALKLAKEEFIQNELIRKRFLREAAIMQEFNHPHLVRLYDKGWFKKNLFYFVSEYLSEGNLLNLSQNQYHNKMPYPIACKLLVQALEGLSHFHGHNHVHRDLKPENILIRTSPGGDYIAKVGDFGLAKDCASPGSVLTKLGDWMGSYQYCPPERLLEFKYARPHSDIYALGITLYHIISNAFPYEYPARGMPRFTHLAILQENPPIPLQQRVPEVPSALSQTLNQAIEKDPKRRFQTAESFKKALEEFTI
ncbi:MAG: FHA domain-containing serine/threonine-protein kinase [Calditrichota bacterium]